MITVTEYESLGKGKLHVRFDNEAELILYRGEAKQWKLREETEISEEEFVRFITGIYRCCLWEWKDEYVDPGVLDGTQWTIRVRLNGQDEKEWYGSNDYPPLWKKFIKAVNTLPLPEIR